MITKMKTVMRQGAKTNKMSYTELGLHTALQMYPILISTLLMLISAASDKSDTNVIYDPPHSCCAYGLDIKGPLKVPAADFLTYQVIDCEEIREGSSTFIAPRRLTPLPLLSKVGVCYKYNERYSFQNPHLDFNLPLSLEEIIEGQLTDVQITFTSGQRPPICRQLSFHINQSLLGLPTTQTIQSQKVDISSCLASDIEIGDFSLHVQTLPWLHNFTYDIKWNNYEDPTKEKIAAWDQLVVGIAPIPSTSQIAVVFQPAKPESRIKSLKLELSSTSLGKLVNSSQISPSATSFVFDQVSPGIYRVKVTPEGPICLVYGGSRHDVCKTGFSPEAFMIENSQKHQTRSHDNGPTSTPPPVLTNTSTNRTTSIDKDVSNKFGVWLVISVVVSILVLALVSCAFGLWLHNKKCLCGPVPTLHMVSSTLSPLEVKAVQHLSLALSHNLRIPVKLSWKDSLVNDGQPDNDWSVLMVYPDSDITVTDCLEKEEQDICVKNICSKDILALVAFSHVRDCFPANINHGSDDFIEDSTFLDIVTNISFKSYLKVIFILFTQQTQPRVPHFFSLTCEDSENSKLNEVMSNPDYQPSLPLKPSKSKEELEVLSVCQPQKICIGKLLSSCSTFYIPHKTQELYNHLKVRLFKDNLCHKFPHADDIVNEDKWVAALAVAKSVLKGQSLFFKDTSIDFTGNCETIGDVSLCSPNDVDDDQRSQKRASFKNDVYIHPPQGIVTNTGTECFDFYTESDSFSNFSEMRKDLFSN